MDALSDLEARAAALQKRAASFRLVSSEGSSLAAASDQTMGATAPTNATPQSTAAPTTLGQHNSSADTAAGTTTAGHEPLPAGSAPMRTSLPPSGKASTASGRATPNADVHLSAPSPVGEEPAPAIARPQPRPAPQQKTPLKEAAVSSQTTAEVPAGAAYDKQQAAPERSGRGSSALPHPAYAAAYAKASRGADSSDGRLGGSSVIAAGAPAAVLRTQRPSPLSNLDADIAAAVEAAGAALQSAPSARRPQPLRTPLSSPIGSPLRRGGSAERVAERERMSPLKTYAPSSYEERPTSALRRGGTISPERPSVHVAELADFLAVREGGRGGAHMHHNTHDYPYSPHQQQPPAFTEAEGLAAFLGVPISAASGSHLPPEAAVLRRAYAAARQQNLHTTFGGGHPHPPQPMPFAAVFEDALAGDSSAQSVHLRTRAAVRDVMALLVEERRLASALADTRQALQDRRRALLERAALSPQHSATLEAAVADIQRHGYASGAFASSGGADVGIGGQLFGGAPFSSRAGAWNRPSHRNADAQQPHQFYPRGGAYSHPYTYPHPANVHTHDPYISMHPQPSVGAPPPPNPYEESHVYRQAHRAALEAAMAAAGHAQHVASHDHSDGYTYADISYPHHHQQQQQQQRPLSPQRAAQEAILARQRMGTSVLGASSAAMSNNSSFSHAPAAGVTTTGATPLAPPPPRGTLPKGFVGVASTPAATVMGIADTIAAVRHAMAEDSGHLSNEVRCGPDGTPLLSASVSVSRPMTPTGGYSSFAPDRTAMGGNGVVRFTASANGYPSVAVPVVLPPSANPNASFASTSAGSTFAGMGSLQQLRMRQAGASPRASPVPFSADALTEEVQAIAQAREARSVLRRQQNASSPSADGHGAQRMGMGTPSAASLSMASMF